MMRNQKNHGIRLIGLLGMALLMTGTGCGRVAVPEPENTTARRMIAGYSKEGRPIEMVIMGRGPECVMMVATIHGNEWAGTPLLNELEHRLNQAPHLLEGKRLAIIPVANPDGRAAGVRLNSRGVDLNRNFPADNRIDNQRNGLNGLSEPESQLLHDLILKYRPARIVTIHQPLACIDWDGPGGPLARAMSGVCDLPAKKLGSLPGSMGSWVGEVLGIPIITLELRKNEEQLPPGKLWEKYGPALLVFLAGPQ